MVESLPMSFYVVSVKDRIQESTGNIMYPPYCYQAFSDEIETLRATDPRIWVLSTKIMTLCSHYMLEKDLLATPLRKQLKT
jgi:hypothetical protein